MTPRDDLSDVEPVDDVPGPGGATADDGAPSAEVGRRGRRTAVLGGAGLVLALAVGGVVGQVVGDRGEDAAAMAAVVDLPSRPYSVDLLTGPPEPAWETSGRFRMVFPDVPTPGGLLVGVPQADQGPVAVRAVDPATGAEVWRTELLDGSTGLESATGARTGSLPGWCVPAGSRADLVTCWVGDGGEMLTDAGSTDVPPSETRVVTLDSRDGSVVTDVTDALGARVVDPSFAAVADVVVVMVPAEGGADVVAVGPDGSERWRSTVALPDGADEQGLLVQALGDHHVVVDSSTGLRLLDLQGRTVRSWDGDAPSVGSDLVAGRVHLVSAPEGEPEDVRTTVLLPEGDLELAGAPLMPLDDGSVPDLLLTAGDGWVTAWDTAGEQVWTRDVGVWANAVLIGGRLHLAGDDVVTLDARTGEEMWGSTVTTGALVADGRHLIGLARAPGEGGRRELVALDPMDGTEMWRSPLPDGTDEVTAYGRMLVAVDRADDDLRLTVLR